MKAIRSCCLVFSMYSKIPMPRQTWDDHDMEYVFCFFPLVGVVEGLLFLLWWHLSLWFGFSVPFVAVGCVVLPLLLTGGIHLDGFCDTSDALASHQSRERKLEILKDSNIGAFALIDCAIYLLVMFACWCQGTAEKLDPWPLAMIPVMSRIMSAFAAVTWKNARGSGMLATFTNAATGKRIRIVLTVWLCLCIVGLAVLNLRYACAIVLTVSITYRYYNYKAMKEFGGITGDLAGWYLQLCELLCLLVVVWMERVVAIL